MGVFGAAVLGWHISLAKCLMHGLMKSKKLCSRGTNTFVLRQLWDRLGSNALMAGLLAVLLTFAVAGANISFTQKASAQASLDRTVPFDIVGCLDPSADYAYDFDQAGDIIESVVPVRETLDYNVYIDGTRPVTSAVGFTVAYDNDSSAASLMEQSGPPDYYVRLSDFNRFAEALGQETLPEDGRFYIVSDISLSLELPEDMILEKNGINAEYGGFIGSFPRIAFVYYVVVVPDAMTRGMDIAYMYRNFTLQHNDFDSEALYRALSYRTTDWNFGEKDQCDYEIKAYTRMENNSTSAILVVGALYIAMIFVFMAMAVLALKTLAGIDEDRRRFRTLYQIGTAPRVLKQTLFGQIFIFFFFPAVLPVALSPIIAWMCARIVTLSGFAELSMTLYLNGAVIALLILGIYALYFGAAWQIARRHVFQ